MWRMRDREFNGRFGTQMLQRNCTGSPKTYFLIEVKCITKHGDFSAMTNRTVLLQVGPNLLRGKNGKAIVAAMVKLRTSEYHIREYCF